MKVILLIFSSVNFVYLHFSRVRLKGTLALLSSRSYRGKARMLYESVWQSIEELHTGPPRIDEGFLHNTYPGKPPSKVQHQIHPRLPSKATVIRAEGSQRAKTPTLNSGG